VFQPEGVAVEVHIVLNCSRPGKFRV